MSGPKFEVLRLIGKFGQPIPTPPPCSRCGKDCEHNWCEACAPANVLNAPWSQLKPLCKACEGKYRVCLECYKGARPLCSRPGCNKAGLWKCSRCKQRQYCSREHQKTDWGNETDGWMWRGSNHREECKEGIGEIEELDFVSTRLTFTEQMNVWFGEPATRLKPANLNECTDY